MGCSVPSIIWLGVELMQITMQRTRPAWSAKTKSRMTLNCSRIAKEIAMKRRIFVEGRRQTLLHSYTQRDTTNMAIKIEARKNFPLYWHYYNYCFWDIPRGTHRLFSLKYPVRRWKCCLEFSFTRGRLKICRWTFHPCTILEVYPINSLRFSEV